MSDKHDKAVELTEQAVEAIDRGDDKTADRLVDQAKKLDPSGPKEVLKDMEDSAEA